MHVKQVSLRCGVVGCYDGPMEKTPSEILGTDGQICHCAPEGLPLEPLDQHSFGCLFWDYAMAIGLITPAERMEQIRAYDKTLHDWR